MKNRPLSLRLLLATADMLVVIVSFALAYYYRIYFDDRPFYFHPDTRTFVSAVIGLIPAWLAINAFSGLYDRAIFLRRWHEYGKILIVSVVSVTFMITYGFFIGEETFPARIIAVYFVGINFTLMVAARELVRLLYRIMFTYRIGRKRLLVVGDDATTLALAKFLNKRVEYGYDVVGVVTKSGSSDSSALPMFLDFRQAVKKTSPNTIIQTNKTHSQEVYHYAALHHIAYMFVPQQDRIMSRLSRVEIIDSLPVIEIHQTPLVGGGRVLKRLMDIILSTAALIVFSPIMVLVILIMKITAPGEAVFYRQTRLTRFNRRVGIYKFRSMKPSYNGLSPEEAFEKMGRPELVEVYRNNGDQLEDDPRMSKLGKFLRATSLDELPQLYNVLRGDISLVGPRALVPQEINRSERKHIILSVKSGLTGLAQVSGRRDISFEERRRLDVYYVQNWSLLMDVQILFRTIGMVLFRRGAK